MTKYTLVVDGMMCGMCESHVNDAVRKAFPVKKVTSSHSRKQTVVVAEEPIDEARLRQVIDATGYTVQSVSHEPYEKKGLFSWENERNRGAERRPALRPLFRSRFTRPEARTPAGGTSPPPYSGRRPRRGGQRAPRPCGPAGNRPPTGTPPLPPAPGAPGTHG